MPVSRVKLSQAQSPQSSFYLFTVNASEDGSNKNFVPCLIINSIAMKLTTVIELLANV